MPQASFKLTTPSCRGMNIVWQNWKKGKGVKNVKKGRKKEERKKKKETKKADYHGGVSMKTDDKLS